MTQIAQLIKKISKDGKDTHQNIVMCTVVSVDGIECVCQPIDEGEAEFQGVALCAEDVDAKFMLTPVVGSIVGVAMMSDSENTDYIIVLYSEIDSILLRGDQYGGLIKVEELVSKVNALENLVNNILTTLKSTTIPLAPSGTYPFAPLYTSFNNISPITMREDLENENVTHG